MGYFDWLYELFSGITLGLVVLLKGLVLFIFIYGLYALLKSKKTVSSIEGESYTSRYQGAAAQLLNTMPTWKSRRRLFDKKFKEKEQERPFLYVLDFDGDMKASDAESLATMVSLLQEILQPQDKVLVKIHSSGGFVPHYGYAASQLSRLKHLAPLTVAVDKIAASGGYLMACVAHEIIAAPFAIVGSIGVVGVVPYLYPWLKNHGIEMQEHTAGAYKRSLTPWGERTPEKVARYQQELEKTHELFQSFVSKYRPALDKNILASGEYRYAAHSVGPEGLVDALESSQDFINRHVDQYHVIFLLDQPKSSLWQKLFSFGVSLSERFLWGSHA